ncbi:hypothetical protein [Gimesia sp.]|uniref:hypothetical protein n=1 Tax=Gimesia sp. TaxID=2024833 RepID=UPI003A8EAC2B
MVCVHADAAQEIDSRRKYFTRRELSWHQYASLLRHYDIGDLDNAMHNHWDSDELPLHETQVPLIVIIFKNRNGFEAYASQIVESGVKDMHGFYASQSNRMVLYDLTATPDGPPPRLYRCRYPGKITHIAV